MGQKVNPISLRLGKTNKHFHSCWYSQIYYTSLINRDLNIESYISAIFKALKYASPSFFIVNLPFQVKINIFFLNALKKDRLNLLKKPKAFNFIHSALTKKISSNIQAKKHEIKLKKKITNCISKTAFDKTLRFNAFPFFLEKSGAANYAKKKVLLIIKIYFFLCFFIM